MKVLVADSFQEAGIRELRGLGCEVAYEPKLKDDALREAISRTGCAVLVVRSTQVNEAMLNASRELALVVRAGAGVNTIDIAAANRRSILVANCPGKNAVAVAELTFALILALDRRVVENVVDLRNGVWNKAEYSRAQGLKDRTLGVIGLGQIGEAVVRRAQAFEMNVVAWSRSLTAAKADALRVTRCGTPTEAAAACDVLTIHLAAAKETKNLVNAEVIGRLKPGAYVINTARADVVDYAALAAAIKEKNLRVGVDVFPDEPAGGTGAFGDAIVQAGGVVYGTHHIGASTEQAQEAIAAEAVRIVRVFKQTGQVENCVNIRAVSPAKCVVVVRHRNRPGVLAHTLNAISQMGANVEEMENVICEGAENAVAFIKLDAVLSREVLAQIQSGNEHVIGVSASAR